jgi:hypothetical protein
MPTSKADAQILSFSLALLLLLLLLLSSYRALHDYLVHGIDDEGDFSDDLVSGPSQDSIMDADQISAAALHTLRICSLFSLLDEDLGFWVKPRSTTWFS